jgi:hypothetical protein
MVVFKVQGVLRVLPSDGVAFSKKEDNPVYQRAPLGETNDILDGRHVRFGQGTYRQVRAMSALTRSGTAL